MDVETGVSSSEKQSPCSPSALDGEVGAGNSEFRGREIEIQHAPHPHQLGFNPGSSLL